MAHGTENINFFKREMKINRAAVYLWNISYLARHILYCMYRNVCSHFIFFYGTLNELCAIKLPYRTDQIQMYWWEGFTL